MPPLPKPAATRQRTNRSASRSSVEALPATKPELPKRRKWHYLTVQWWDTIWASPLSALWIEADVPALLMLAALTEEYWRDGALAVAVEIRQRQQAFGLTPLDRRRLEWEVQRVEAGKPKEQPAQLPEAKTDPRLRMVK